MTKPKKEPDDGKLAPDSKRVQAYVGSTIQCRCCGQEGRHISGCGCHGGGSHKCLRDKPLSAVEFAALRLEKDIMKDKKVWCTCCGAEGRTRQGCSCLGGKSHTCLRLAGKAAPPSAKAAAPPVGYAKAVVSEIQDKPKVADKEEPRGVSASSTKSASSYYIGENKELRAEIVLTRWRKLFKKLLPKPMLVEEWTDVVPEDEPDGSKRKRH